MKAPTKAQISAVMAALGRKGNIGRKKRMTRRELAQRKAAARVSADVRRRQKRTAIPGHQPRGSDPRTTGRTRNRKDWHNPTPEKKGTRQKH